MKNQRKFKIFSLLLLLFVAITGLIFGSIGSTELLRNADQIRTSVQLPVASQIASKTMWVAMSMCVLYIFIFKERKRNLFWLLLSFFGIIIFSIKKLVGEWLYAKEN